MKTESIDVTLPDDRVKAGTVKNMFGRIAGRYDLMNRLMTFGRDRAWHREVVRRAALPVGGRLLDIGSGTGGIVGAALDPRAETSEKFKQLKDRLEDYGIRTGKPLWREGAYLLRPLKAEQVSTGCEGVALIGEAGGWISPSSAEGLSYAFRSAMLLAEALKESLQGFEKRYHNGCRHLRCNLFIKRLKSCFIFNPVLRNLVMRSGLQALDLYSF